MVAQTKYLESFIEAVAVCACSEPALSSDLHMHLALCVQVILAAMKVRVGNPLALSPQHLMASQPVTGGQVCNSRNWPCGKD